MDGSDNPDYKVGYKKPPLHSRWKPGESGNSEGSKPEPNDIAGFTDKHLKKKRRVKGENGRWKKITNEEVIAIQEVDKAAHGDYRATKAIKEHQRTRVKAKLEVSIADHEAVKAALDRLAEERAAAAKPEPEEPEPEPPQPEEPATAPPSWPSETRAKEVDDGWR